MYMCTGMKYGEGATRLAQWLRYQKRAAMGGARFDNIAELCCSHVHCAHLRRECNLLEISGAFYVYLVTVNS